MNISEKDVKTRPKLQEIEATQEIYYLKHRYKYTETSMEITKENIHR